MEKNKKKIAVIVQRYGSQVNGGAEVHAKMIAEKLNERYDVTVLTSRAVDYHTWKPELPEGLTEENGVKILRFNHPPRGAGKRIHYFNRKHRERHPYQKLYKWLGRPKWYLRLVPGVFTTEKNAIELLALQGPAVADMLTYIRENKNNYQAFIFFTYLYYPSALGVMIAPEKSIFIPTMHDEPPAYFNIYKKVMAAPEWIFFNTVAEKEFSEKMFPIEKTKKKIVAVGIDPVPENRSKDALQKFGIKEPYLIYVGRINNEKGCDVLIKYFMQFLQEAGELFTLVLVGKSAIEIPGNKAVKHTGFVTDDEKQQLMQHAKALIIPSLYESLSLVLLESFACKIPVIANGNCQVLKDHIDLSGGGWKYFNYPDFKNILMQVANNDQENSVKGLKGYDYVTKNYTWQKVLNDFDEAIEEITTNNNHEK